MKDFPEGIIALGEQLDLREMNSWRLTLEQVSTKEFLEVQVINSVAPFIITARLRGLMKRSPPLTTSTATSTTNGDWFGGPYGNDDNQREKEKEKGEKEKEKEERVHVHEKGKNGEKVESKFIINVSAMEGQFYRFKTERHPHTNMAKVNVVL